MADPVLIEVTRGSRVESAHRGAVAVIDAAGRPVAAIGDVGRAVFPRSAVKAMQALLLVESGAADAYGFGDRELALASASHGGEPAHAALAETMLQKAGLGEGDLECGAHPPSHEASRNALIAAGTPPSQLHNNCSGKHAGFLCAACHAGWRTKGYVGFDHPVQAALRDILGGVTETSLTAGDAGTDGCSIPTYAVPLRSLAQGFAKMATGEGLSSLRAKASRRLFAACMNEPFYVAGSGRFCTGAMQLFGGRLFVKTGAEGVFCAAFPKLGLGVALKCDDGAGRASEAMVATVVEAFLKPEGEERAAFARWVEPPVLTVRGAAAGRIAATEGFREALAHAAGNTRQPARP